MSSGAPPRTRSPKGEREAARIRAAATAVLAREGIAGATLGRVAAEAGVDKRMIVYYFSGRDALLAEVVRDVGARVTAGIEASVASLTDPDEVADVAIDALWAGSTTVPEFARAYLTLVTGAREADGVGQALEALEADVLRAFGARIDAIEANGHRLLVDRDGFMTLVLALWRGLALQWFEHGDSDALRSALEQFKRVARTSIERGPK